MVDNTLYEAITTLSSMKRVERYVFFTINSPKIVKQLQKRKYYRVSSKRVCVLIATDNKGNSAAFMSRLVDISAGGVLIHQLESMYDSSYIDIEPQDYERFNVVLFLELDTVLKLQARYIRQEKTADTKRYAFEFVDINPNDTNTIGKFVAKEQNEQLKNQHKY